MSVVPPSILASIQSYAEKEWPSESWWQASTIKSEIAAYINLQTIEFGTALPFRERILASAPASFAWEERFLFVKEEVDALEELDLIEDFEDVVPKEDIDRFRRSAGTHHEWFKDQLGEVNKLIKEYKFTQEARKKIGPIRELLIKMEEIISSECHNDHIQNYSSWGEWEGEGRSFRYPVTFYRNRKLEKWKKNPTGLQPEELITGHYTFGANDLSIYRALVRVLDMLEADYGFTPAKATEE